MKKRQFIILLISLFVIGNSLFAIENKDSIQNYQKTYNNQSEEYIVAVMLCRIANSQLPSASTPITGAALLKTLDKIDITKLNDEEYEIYNNLMKSLKPEEYFYSSEDFATSVSITESAEVYLNHSFDDYPIYYRDALFGYKDRLPWNDWYADFYYGNNAYLKFNVYSEDIMGNVDSISDVSLNTLYLSDFDTNLDTFIFKNFELTNTYHNYNCEGVIGNDNMAFMLGRNKLNEGRGQTGNLLISDNFRFQEYMKYSFYSDFVSYHMTLTQFGTQDTDEEYEAESFTSSGYQQVRIIHRIEFNPFDNFGMVLSSGATMYTDNPYDFRNLFPFDFIHNHYNTGGESYSEGNGDEINNIASLEFDFYPIKKWSMHIQLLSDQYKMATEGESSTPPATGSLFNIEYSTVIKKGLFDAYIEFVHTNPYLYLNTKYTDEGSFYNLDHIYGYTTVTGKELAYSGYYLGPYTTAIGTGCSYRVPDIYNIDFDILYAIHGPTGISWVDTTISNLNFGQTIEDTEDDIKEHSLYVTLTGSYEVIDGITLGAKLGNRFQWNKDYQEGAFHSDFQSLFNIQVDVIKLLNIKY